MEYFANSVKGEGIECISENVSLLLRTIDTSLPLSLLKQCPMHKATPLSPSPEMHSELKVNSIFLKDERERMQLGSFKALGAFYALAKRAYSVIENSDYNLDYSTALKDNVYICASAGNHGLSLAAGAKTFGARAIIYLSETVPEKFADMLRSKNAEIIRAGNNYEESMEAALFAAKQNGWELISDSSWEGYYRAPLDVMEGYLIMGDEAAEQLPAPPTHIFLQAGVGGMAASCALSARRHFGQDVKIIIVEPELAPALFESIRAKKIIDTQGGVSSMGRLDCKTPSVLALDYLAREADGFMLISENEAQNGVDMLKEHGIITSPSGGAGASGFFEAMKNSELKTELNLGDQSNILLYISEGAVDD